MDFELNEEQKMLRDAVSSFVSRQYPFTRRRQTLTNQDGEPDIWRAIALELGLLGATFPEDMGGTGGGAIEAMVIAREMGRALFLQPYIETAILGGTLLISHRYQTADLVEAFIAGNARPIPALAEPASRFNLERVTTRAEAENGMWALTGEKMLVVGGEHATHFIVSALTVDPVGAREGVSLLLVEADAPGLCRADYGLIDGRRASDIRLTATPGQLLGEPAKAAESIALAADCATAALCAEALGVMEEMLNRTVHYSKERKQFGKPIGSFQVLQHRMVDMLLSLERSISMTYMATLSLGHPFAERAKAISAAKALVSEALRNVGHAAIQIHGGIGTVEEMEISHFFKRATAIQSQFGPASFHYDRMARLSEELEEADATA